MSDTFLQRHHLLFRRLHSLAGIVPIGVFMMIHLTTNSSIVWGEISHGGAETFNHEVAFIHSLPFLILIEIFGLWIPIAFHAALGIVYALSGSPNVGRYGYMANWRYTVQRYSGYVGVVFLFYHIATLRWGWTWLPYSTVFVGDQAARTTALALQGGTPGLDVGGVVVSVFYLICVSLLCFHLANGLWTAAITWGLTVSKAAQRRWGYVCAVVGVVLLGMAWMAVAGFALHDVESAVPRHDAGMQASIIEPVSGS